jgi:DNA-directed RNA polymerase subunit RPC12/RpoP
MKNNASMEDHWTNNPRFAEAKQEQGEPVGEAYLCDKCSTPFDGDWECPSCGHNTSTKEPVYTTPQQRTWVGLTHEEIDYQAKKDDHGFYFALGALWAEVKLKEKNT